MLTSDVLKQAKQELLTRGWCQGMYYSRRTGAVCALGATNLAATHGCHFDMPCDFASAELDAAWGLLDRVTTGQPASHGRYIPDWNDNLERTKQDVLDAFDAAIAIALAEELAEPEGGLRGDPVLTHGD